MVGRSKSAIEPADGPLAVENRGGKAPFLVLCDHASNFVPAEFGTLGLDRAALDAHIAWDPGALGVARGLAARLDAPLVYGRVTRLVVDLNRFADDDDLVVTVSDGIEIPGNRDLSQAERDRRVATYHAPYHAAVAALIDEMPAAPAIIAVHSFTPVYGGRDRPWQIGVVFGADRRLAEPLIAGLRAGGDVVVGVNEPYGPGDRVYRTLEYHAEPRGLASVMLEIRNDEIADAAAEERWAERLAGLVAGAMPSRRVAVGG
ncbi:MAG TPA: N-formylglutamate amidohydrolase [Hyphomicrobiales bacterium]|nr:N-formylglutamate amidohydrolase [Hyphomicrobiales bacterium]